MRHLDGVTFSDLIKGIKENDLPFDKGIFFIYGNYSINVFIMTYQLVLHMIMIISFIALETIQI